MNFLIIFSLIPFTILNIAHALETIDELCENLPVGSRIPHPEDCNLYLKCASDNDESFALLIGCQNNLYFNPKTLQCDPDYESEICPKLKTSRKSDKKTTPKKPPTLKTKKTTIKPQSTTTTQKHKKSTTTILDEDGNDLATTTTTTIDLNNNMCPEVDSDQVRYFRNKEDCTKFFMCYHGRALPLRCWNGLHFSPEHMTCVPKEISKCSINNTPYPNCPIFGRAFLPHPEECRYFFYCANGVKTIQRCGSFDYWDIIDKRCKRKSEAICYSENK